MRSGKPVAARIQPAHRKDTIDCVLYITKSAFTVTSNQSLQDLLYAHSDLTWPGAAAYAGVPWLLAHRDVTRIVETQNLEVPPPGDPRLENISLIFSLCFKYARDDVLSERFFPVSKEFWKQISREFHAQTSDDGLPPPKYMRKIENLCMTLVVARGLWLGLNRFHFKKGLKSRIPTAKWVTMINLFGLACKRRYELGLELAPQDYLNYDVFINVEETEQEIRLCLNNLPSLE